MTVIIPDPAISERWRVAREAAELRKPFDLFLATHDIKQPATRVDRDTALIARTANFILHAGYVAYIRHVGESAVLTPRLASMLAKICFTMTEGLAELLGKGQHSQVAGSIVVANVFANKLGASAAARLSVEGMVWCCLKHAESITNTCLIELGRQAARAVARNTPEQFELVVESIQTMMASAAEEQGSASG